MLNCLPKRTAMTLQHTCCGVLENPLVAVQNAEVSIEGNLCRFGHASGDK